MDITDSYKELVIRVRTPVGGLRSASEHTIKYIMQTHAQNKKHNPPVVGPPNGGVVSSHCAPTLERINQKLKEAFLRLATSVAALLTVAVLVAVAVAVMLTAATAQARMLFDSEFNPGPLRWAVQQGTNQYWTGQCWMNDQLHVYKWRGLLQLKATTGNACGTGYESGAVYIPDNQFHYTYGWAGARIKVPCQSGFGVWPGFWQYAQAIPNSNVGGEIDTMEEMDVAAYPRRTVEQSLHSTGQQATSQVFNSVPWCREFHVFENHWQLGKVSFYIDGRHTHTIYTNGNIAPESPVLSLLVGYYGGTPNPATFPQSELIDWVRIWN